METDNITILEEDLEAARTLCTAINDPIKRSKAVSNIFASLIAKRLLDNDNYDVDTDSGLHNIASLVDDYEISDIYINNKPIYARVYFSDEELCIPKSHYDLGILPFAYMFIKLDTDLKNASLTGFIRSSYIDTDKYVDNVYLIQKEQLISFYDIESKLIAGIDTQEIDIGTMYDLLDNVLSEDKKAEVIKSLILSYNNRLKFIKIAKSVSTFNFISINNAGSIPQEINSFDSEIEELFDISDNNESKIVSNDFSFTTEVTPSGAGIINDIDNNIDSSSDSATDKDDFIDIFSNAQTEDETQQLAPNNGDPIETLFTEKQSSVSLGKKKNSNSILVIILLFFIICVVGYFYANKQDSSLDDGLSLPNSVNSTESNDDIQPVNTPQPVQSEQQAMPVETVENTTIQNNKEEAISVSIPEIEHNLDASILISNLKVDWEVPEGYTSNTAAKRYLIKLGKIIQLNLKSELLLINKVPLTNKIAIELKYNPSLAKFEIAKIQKSSGDKSIDDIIEASIKSALNLNIKTNMDSFAKIKGNPVIIIRL